MITLRPVVGLFLVDACLGMEEFHGVAEDDYDSWTEFPCPFCSEAFDVVSLCLHIDKKHPWEYTKAVIAIDYCYDASVRIFQKEKKRVLI